MLSLAVLLWVSGASYYGKKGSFLARKGTVYIMSYDYLQQRAHLLKHKILFCKLISDTCIAYIWQVYISQQD